MTKQFRCRTARRSDADEVFAVLKEVAAEIPVKLETEEASNCLKGLVEEKCGNGKSLIAVYDGHAIGFLPAQTEDYRGLQFLSIDYVGVAKDWRGKGVFRAFMERIKGRGLPLLAEVKYANKSNIAKKLVDCFGFHKDARSIWEDGDYFVWVGRGN